MDAVSFDMVFTVFAWIVGTAITVYGLLLKLSRDRKIEADKADEQQAKDAKEKMKEADKLNQTLIGLSDKISQNRNEIEALVRETLNRQADQLRRELDSRLDGQDQKIAKVEARLESGSQQMARIEERLAALPDNKDFADLKAKQAEMVATLAGQTRTLDLIRESLMVDKRGGS